MTTNASATTEVDDRASRADTARPPFVRRRDARTGEAYLEVALRGTALKDEPLLNKGTCFTDEERRAFGLAGLMPPAVSTPEDQAARAYENFRLVEGDTAKYLFLSALQDRNETLFHRLVLDHLEEMLPIVYTPTVGTVCEHYSHLYRRPRGVYISTRDRGRIAETLANVHRADVEIIVATDNAAILGLGDQGVGGMGIAIGKSSLYTAGAGIHPARTLPLDIDVGTDNPALLADPLYLGVREPRLTGEAYFSLVDELVAAIAHGFPRAIVQWEDFANERAFEVLRRYQRRLPSFNDDIQGTGAIVEAAVRSALARAGRDLADERFVFFGAGASGAGCALQMRRALAAAGLTAEEAARRVLCLDSRGLLLSDRPGLAGHKRDVAADPVVAAGWRASEGDRFTLTDVIREFQPTILVGASGQPGAFTEDRVRMMASHCARPIVLPLSNPTSKAEATPADILRWTNGAAIVAAGSPFPPVGVNGVTYEIGQCNNVFVFPGIGLGATVARARSIPDAAFAAAARAVADARPLSSNDSASLFPPISRLRAISRAVAVATATALIEAGAAPDTSVEELQRRIDATTWEPTYLPYRLTT